MRVLFTTVPAVGHLYPTLPLARALRGRDDVVAYAGPPSLGQLMTGEDVEVLTAGCDIPELAAELARRVDLPSAPGEMPPATEAELFAGVRVDLAFDDTLAAARRWRPDLVVGDTCDYVGPMVAAALGVPYGNVTLGQQFEPARREAHRARAASQYRQRGLSQRAPAFSADICPPALQSDDWQQPERWLPMRPEAHRVPGAPVVPATTGRSTPERPRVLLTFGTLYGAVEVLSPLIEEIVALDVDLHVTLGLAATAEDFGVDRNRVTFEPFAPIAELLSGVDLVVSHAGAGTTYAALAAGIPLVLLPQGADQFSVADRAVTAGAALRLLPGEATPAGVRRLITAALTEPRYRAAAAEVAHQIADMPPATSVAESIALIMR
ncbi:UDP:flavonoid glycosyltransferase YjiC, YdhE family [Lentzea xinjiangensis]|uniref:UDP:flavonoid glycosyltransferase YjiC, YdhE family n=1 Tax=Lentzea xinjiangensis TaxID=402600 RepID=A0A1H9V123_9PSEU|nr:glycosyltransferase [Lentzea xinjiangensis]SES14977.1 UDP:flavonoid glycosyltransferase YjiC, YdhE family [Lentzea xinjiangensis]